MKYKKGLQPTSSARSGTDWLDPWIGMGNSGLEGSPASKQGGDGLGKALPSREQDLDDEEVQSLPKPAVVPSNFNFAGKDRSLFTY